MKKIVIIGASLSGIISALELKKRIGSLVDITLISRDNLFVLNSYLASVIVGFKQLEDIAIPLEGILLHQKINFLQAEALYINVTAQEVLTKTDKIAYNYLIIATGSELDKNKIAGLNDETAPFSAKTGHEATLISKVLAKKLLADSEKIVIGNAQGVRDPFFAYELIFMIHHQLQIYKKKIKLSFFTPEPFLGHFGIGGTGQFHRLLENEFNNKSIEFYLNAEIDVVTSKIIALKDQTVFPHTFAMITPPYRGAKFITHSDQLNHTDGFLSVDRFNRYLNDKNIYVLGSAVKLSSPIITSSQIQFPTTDNISVITAIIAATHIASVIRGSDVMPPLEQSMSFIINSGYKSLLFSVKPIFAPRYGLKLVVGRRITWQKAFYPLYLKWKLKHW